MIDTENLFLYQKEGVDFLSSKKVGLLADEMGLGKSAQAIVAADKVGAKRVIVVCPAVARLNWLREFEKFSTLKRDFEVVTTRVKELPKNKSIICSYDLAARIDKSCFGHFDVVLLDEVHYLKNHTAKRTKAILGKEGLIHGQKAKTRIWVLSGTPAPNHAGELWPLLYSFGVTDLKYTDFIKRFCNVTPSVFGHKAYRGEESYWQVTGTKRQAIPELRRILNGIMLRRMKKDVAKDLPKIFYSNIVVEPGEVDLEKESSFIQYVFPDNRVAELEQRIKDELLLMKRAVNESDIEILKGLSKSVSTLRRYIGIQKVEKTAEMVAEELRNNLYEKIVIFAIHRDVIEGLRVRLKDFGALTLYGGTRFDSANKNIDRFQNVDKYRVFIGNITACGIAINLSAAHNVLMIEQEWVPASNAQAIARCHRHGQKNPVSVRVVGLANSLDEKISKILKKKTEELTQLFDSSTTGSSLTDLLS